MRAPQSLGSQPFSAHGSDLVDQDGCLSSSNTFRRGEKGQKYILLPFKDPSWKMTIPLPFTSLCLEFNYMAIPGVKEIGEFHFFPGKLRAQLAFGSSMIKGE